MRLVVARIGRAHGVRGEVTVEVHTDVPEKRFVPGVTLYVSDGSRFRELRAAGHPTRLTLSGVRDHNGTVLLQFAELPDRSRVEVFRNVLLEADVPEDEHDQDAWYDSELVGLPVTDPQGLPLGEVVGVEHRPVQDLLVVRRPSGEERLVPFVRELVPVVDPRAGRVVVDAPAGLLDDGAGDAGG